MLPQRAALWSRCYLDIARAPFLLALVVATAAGLSACGGGSDEGAPGPARTETLVVARADGELTRCVGGDNCEEAPEACEEDAECAGTFCAPESGGCEPLMGFFDDGNGLRGCFDMRVHEAVVVEQAPDTEPPPDVTESGAADPTDTPEPMEPTATPAAAAQTRVEIDCRGPSFPLDGLDLGAVEETLRRSDDGTVVWSEEPVRLRGEIVDGVFEVADSP